MDDARAPGKQRTPRLPVVPGAPRGPGGRRTPRRISGDLAEQAVANHLEGEGWTLLARNVRVLRVEIDIIALDPWAAVMAIIEVRSRTVRAFGEPEESVDGAKVARLYRAARELMRSRQLPDGRRLPDVPIRVDLVSVTRDDARAGWRLGRHIEGIEPP